MNNAAQVEFLCRKAREALGKVKAGLATENRTCTGASAIGTIYTVVNNILK
jgi:hypothetical protein